MKRILVAPLDWGLGHATRCIPIIRELLSQGCEVFIAGNGDSLLLLKQEFPNLTFFGLTGYNPVYSSGYTLVWKMAMQVPKFIRAIRKEHQEVTSLVDSHRIDIVISDNRYGCWSPKIPSVFVTHQVNILMPKGYWWLEKVINDINKRMIKKFTWCWIPDHEEHEKSLAGKLSQPDKRHLKHAIHVGPLSRFIKSNGQQNVYDVACVLSGPEPQRTIFENKITEQLKNLQLRFFIIRGVFKQNHLAPAGEASHLNSVALQDVIEQSACVIARSGYSTIMDLLALGKRAILVPTPGQTEQEYLAARWRNRGVLYAVTQADFNLNRALLESKSYPGFKASFGEDRRKLKNAIDLMLKPVGYSHQERTAKQGSVEHKK